MQKGLSRRDFLANTGLLTIGFSLMPAGSWSGPSSASTRVATGAGDDALPASLAREPRIDAWLQVLDDGRIRILTGKIELGQGIRIAIAQVAAEELSTDVDRVDVHVAETEVTPNERYTSGSMSIEHSAMSVRYAAAAAREVLLERAAKQLQMDSEQLYVEDGQVKSDDGADAISFVDLLGGEQIEDEVTTPVALKPKSEHRWVGQPVPRKDIGRMVRGEPVYVHDLRFPDMVHARVVRPRGYGAELLSYDEDALRAQVKGVLKLVVDGSFVGVIAEDEFQAERAQNVLAANAEWSTPEPLPADRPLKDHLKALPAESEHVEERGMLSLGDRSLRASYFRPYIMHGAMGPSCAVARFDGDRLQVWTHSQGVYPLRESLRRLVGLPSEKIHIKGVPGSGCYGHNGADDVAADAALLAMAYPDRHVRLQWSRADEHGWEPYGSAMIMDVEASLDASGRIDSWRYELWSDTHSTRPGGDPGNLLPARHVDDAHPLTSHGYRGGGYRNAVPYYALSNVKVDAHFFSGPLRVSALRSLGAHANVFAIESFMDELAEAAGTDPLDFRRMHLDDPRARAALDKIEEMTAAETAGDNEGIGYGFSRYKNTASYCAVAAKVAVDDDGAFRITKMWGAIDAGEVINPDGLRNQTEGGMIQSASWMMKEAVRFDEEHVTSLDWHSYPIVRYEDVPDVVVAVIDRPEERPLGAGEAAQGPATAAIANAIYRASGTRVRDLPVDSVDR